MKFKCVQSTQSINGGFMNKLVSVVAVPKTVTVFGVTKTEQTKETVYMKTDAAIPVGAEDDIDLNLFDVVLSDFVTPDGNVIPLKRLTIKRERLASKAVAHYAANATVVKSRGI